MDAKYGLPYMKAFFIYGSDAFASAVNFCGTSLITLKKRGNINPFHTLLKAERGGGGGGESSAEGSGNSCEASFEWFYFEKVTGCVVPM